jgi:hypothetical protein
MSLLLNDYPLNFITKHFNRCFQLNNAMPVLEQLDQKVYQQLHNKLLSKPIHREKQLEKMMQDPVRYSQVLQTKIWNYKVMYSPYKFDSGLTINFLKEFYRWWKKYYVYSGSNVNNVKVRFIPKTNRTLEQIFIHKKPTGEMLTRMESSTT